MSCSGDIKVKEAEIGSHVTSEFHYHMADVVTKYFIKMYDIKLLGLRK